MARFIALFLSIVILFKSSGFNLMDLTKTGYLIEHAQFHAEKYGDSFWDFLIKYYGFGEAGDVDNHDHENLPFQHASVCSCIMFTENNSLEIITEKLYFQKKEKKKILKDDFFYPLTIKDIFQPPRLA
ncbi:MAG TPA: hypothetical protein VK027_00110 [Chitinophagaceae bacterium]|nr:hypothetical protein [Chitinophagaceae bacterium]